MELGKFENKRTFHTATSRQTVIRDAVVKQVDPPKQKEIKEEPQIEIKMSGEPSLQDIKPTPTKRRRTKKTTNEKA